MKEVYQSLDWLQSESIIGQFVVAQTSDAIVGKDKEYDIPAPLQEPNPCKFHKMFVYVVPMLRK